MPDVRLAATGMDSCPASDEDTEDELASARRSSNATRTRLLPSTSRQLVRNSKCYLASFTNTCVEMFFLCPQNKFSRKVTV